MVYKWDDLEWTRKNSTDVVLFIKYLENYYFVFIF